MFLLFPFSWPLLFFMWLFGRERKPARYRIMGHHSVNKLSDPNAGSWRQQTVAQANAHVRAPVSGFRSRSFN
jgi:hypothetical protein